LIDIIDAYMPCRAADYFDAAAAMMFFTPCSAYVCALMLLPCRHVYAAIFADIAFAIFAYILRHAYAVVSRFCRCFAIDAADTLLLRCHMQIFATI